MDTNERIQALFPKPFRLIYVVTLAEHQLSTDIHVENTSSTDTLIFQALLHTYIKAPADEATVSPLQGLKFRDKTDPTPEGRALLQDETRAAVDVKKFTDSVYIDGPGKYTVTWPGGGMQVRAVNFKDVVVWNPQEEGFRIMDMESDGWYGFNKLVIQASNRPFSFLGNVTFVLNLDTWRDLPLSSLERVGLVNKS